MSISLPSLPKEEHAEHIVSHLKIFQSFRTAHFLSFLSCFLSFRCYRSSPVPIFVHPSLVLRNGVMMEVPPLSCLPPPTYFHTPHALRLLLKG